MMAVWVFPGQGSQYPGMGLELFEKSLIFRDMEAQIDEILGYSIKELCLSGPQEKLSKTQFTQPAMYVVNALNYFEAKSGGDQPELLAGHSLGEYNALMAAGAFDFLTGLRLVAERGRVIGEITDGAMAAIIGMPATDIADVLIDHALNGVDVANFNAKLQTVISGSGADIEKAISVLQDAGASACIRLPVGAAFHSRYMLPAAQKFSEFLKGFRFEPLQIPVIANCSALPYPSGDPTVVVRSFLTRQITEPVRWYQSIEKLMSNGYFGFVELGSGNVLTRLIEQTRGQFAAVTG